MIKIILALVISAILLSTTIWECNYCHMQYIGDRPPPFTKCAAKDNKINHWWIKKGKLTNEDR